MVLAHDDDQSSCYSSLSNSTPSGINFTFNVQTGLVDSFSWHGACQPKPGRAIETAFDLSMLSDEISHIEIHSSDDDISSFSSNDSLFICSWLREKTKRFELKAV